MSTRSLVYWIALVGSAEVALRGHLNDDARLFHAGAWVLAALLAGTAWRLGGARGGAVGAAAVLPALLSLLAWAGVPAAPANPWLDFWEAHRYERRVLTTVVSHGPVRMFGQEIPLDHRGYRATRDARTRPDAFRIVALGGSTTFGATRNPEERPWPDHLQRLIDDELECDTPVEVRNAGRLGRALGAAVKGFDQELRPLRPDLILFYPSPQDIAELMSEISADVTPAAAVPPRASSLLRALEAWWKERGVSHRFREAVEGDPPSLELGELPVASTYRRFLLETKRRGIDVALLTGSLAVSGASSDRALREQEAIETRARRIVLANRFHGLLIRGLGASYGAMVVDTQPGLDGGGAEAFLDLFHLTEEGRERLARNVLEGILPVLARSEPGCRPLAQPGREEKPAK